MVDVDALVAEMWEACLAQDENAEVNIDAWHDQWWGVTAECPHGKWTGVSRGPIDVSTGFVSLHRAFIKAHDPRP